MITSEFLHIESNKIFVCIGFEPTEEQLEEFQSMNESEILENENIEFSRDFVEPIITE
jgi:hypothetical protein